MVRPDERGKKCPKGWLSAHLDERGPTELSYRAGSFPCDSTEGRHDPNVSLTLDGTDIGRNIVRVEGVAESAPDQSAAHEQPAYVAKYLERIGVLFGTPERFAERFSSPLLITPTRVYT